MYHREACRSLISSATSDGKVGASWPGESQAFESTRLLSSKHRLGNRLQDAIVEFRFLLSSYITPAGPRKILRVKGSLPDL